MINSFISVAMCTFNGEAYLNEQLESILAQTVLPNELVICDDQSKDSTLEILYLFKKKCRFPVKIIVNSKNLWVTKNFENAIDHCTGDIIVLADQDDIWKPFKIETIIKTFQANPDCGYVFSNADLIDETGNELRRDLWSSIGFNQQRYEKYATGKQLDVMLRDGNFIYGMTMAFRSSFKPKILPIKSQSFACAHDTWICLVLSALNANGVAIPISLVEYRQHSKQVSGGGKSVTFLHFLRSIQSDKCNEDLFLTEALQNIEERVAQEVQNDQCISYHIQQLSDKSKHIRVRASLHDSVSIFQKMARIFLEYISGRYSRFSNGYKSLLKDIVVCNYIMFNIGYREKNE